MKESNPKYSLDDYDFGELAKTESNARARTRLYILHQYRIGKHSFEIAENLNINIETARRTRRRYQASGLDSLYDKPRSGRNSKLAPEYIESFKQLIVDSQAKRGGGRLTGQDIQKLAHEHYQASYSVNGIYELLARIGMSWISARSQHPQADINAQEAFKKNFIEQVTAILPEDTKLSDVDIWFQDETRIGQQGSITRIWHYRGKRPRVVRQQQFISTYLYGAVCPATGQSVGLIMPYANGECMKRHLQEISQAVPKGRHAVVVMDGAVWHKERYNLPNLTILKLPPYSPELNPIEQVWQYIK